MKNGQGKKVLPDPAKKVLYAAIRMAQSFPEAKIVIPNASYYGKNDCDRKTNMDIEFRLKQEIIGDTIDPKRIVIIDVNSTIEEVEKTLKLVCENDIILSIMEKDHARRTRRVWKKFSRDNVIIISVEGEWNKLMPSPFQRGRGVWLFTNIIWHFLSYIPGVWKIISNFHHPVKF